MSKYADKIKKRRKSLAAPQEPIDDYSCIPDYASRLYFRAKAGLYGMTSRTYDTIQIEVSPYIFKRMLNSLPTKLLIPITAISAEACGELARDVGLGKQCRFWIYSIPFGGRMKLQVLKTAETHSPQVVRSGLTISVYGFPKTSKPLRKRWLKKERGIEVIAA